MTYADADDREWALVQLASEYWNEHYKPGDPNPVQIGVPQLIEFARHAASLIGEPTIGRELIEAAYMEVHADVTEHPTAVKFGRLDCLAGILNVMQDGGPLTWNRNVRPGA